MDNDDKYYWYIPKTNTYLSKQESKSVIERYIKTYETLINEISNIYKNYNSLLSEADEYKGKDDTNYLFSISEAISFICMEFEEIIKELDKYDD